MEQPVLHIPKGTIRYFKGDLTKSPPFGKWTVLAFAGRDVRSNTYWLCRCVCGIERHISQRTLLGGTSTSCGCAGTEAMRARQTKHGRCTTPEYDVWKAMVQRCRCSSTRRFCDYGGRGITLCVEWEAFSAFIADMGSRPSNKHSIDRKDNDGPYCRDNCRWATRKEQDSNKRTSRYLFHNGETKTVSAWADSMGVPRNSLRTRLRLGWSVEDAIDTPFKTYKRSGAAKLLRAVNKAKPQ